VSQVDQKEPPPLAQPDSASIQDLVIHDCLAFGFGRVADDIQARKMLGLKKYGTLLQAHNGRDALMDAYQEGLDFANYLRQCQEEGYVVALEYHGTLGILDSLRSQIP
jgi:hypothetical protein